MLLSRYTVTNMTVKQMAEAAGKLNFRKALFKKTSKGRDYSNNYNTHTKDLKKSRKIQIAKRQSLIR